jgi:hypothetical protein
MFSPDARCSEQIEEKSTDDCTDDAQSDIELRNTAPGD